MPDTHIPSEELLKHLCSDSYCKSKGTYTVKAVCTNCDWKGSIELTKGHEFSRSINCPNCACSYTLMRRSS